MKTWKILFAAAALTVLAACSNDDAVTEPTEERMPVTLAYTTVDAVETRAAQNLNEGTFAADEAVTVRISNTSENDWSDYTFTTADAGAMTAPNPAPYYPSGMQNIDIVAYYPATAGTTFSVATDQTTDANYKASDLMFASVTNQAKQADAVNLVFAHKMAKLAVNITAGQGVSSITSVSLLNVKPTVSFDQATGAVGSATGTATSIAMSNNGGAVIPAQTINGNLLSIVTPQGTATYSVSNKAFTAGNLYTMNITVNLYAVGTTTAITGWTSEGTVTVNPVTNQKTPAGLEAVDMGNGLKWASMNVGAESETDYGDYFAWGETMPYYQEGYSQESPCTHWIDGKSGYSLPNYSLCNGTATTMIKYCTDGIYGYVDNKTVLERTHDAASANWGAGWRMPTDAEWTWLCENCTWTWQKNYNGTGVKGMLVRSNVAGYTDNTIFLPAAGFRGNANLSNAGSYGYYWSSSLSGYGSRYARCLCFDSYGGNGEDNNRYFGLSVRAVTE